MTLTSALRIALLSSIFALGACSDASSQSPTKPLQREEASAPKTSTKSNELPLCNDKEVKRLVAEIVDDILWRNPRLQGIRAPSEKIEIGRENFVRVTDYGRHLTAISNTRTISSDNSNRECAGTFTKTTLYDGPQTGFGAPITEKFQISYQLSWTDDGELWAEVSL